MKRYRWCLMIVLLVLVSTSGWAQQKRITLDSCIARALELNYSIKMIQNEQRQAENNVNYASFLPTLAATASQRQNIQDSKVKSGEEERETDSIWGIYY